MSNLEINRKGQQAKMFSYGDWLFYGWPWRGTTLPTTSTITETIICMLGNVRHQTITQKDASSGSEKGVALYIPTIKWGDKLVSYGGIIDIERGWQQQKFTDEIYILDISKCVNESTTDINGFNNVKIVDSEGNTGDKSYKLTQSGAGQPKVGTNVVKRSAYGAAVLGDTMWVIGGYSLGDNSFAQSRIDRKNKGDTSFTGGDQDKDHREVYDKINQINLLTGVWGTEYDIIRASVPSGGADGTSRNNIQINSHSDIQNRRNISVYNNKVYAINNNDTKKLIRTDTTTGGTTVEI